MGESSDPNHAFDFYAYSPEAGVFTEMGSACPPVPSTGALSVAINDRGAAYVFETANQVTLCRVKLSDFSFSDTTVPLFEESETQAIDTVTGAAFLSESDGGQALFFRALPHLRPPSDAGVPAQIFPFLARLADDSLNWSVVGALPWNPLVVDPLSSDESDLWTWDSPEDASILGRRSSRVNPTTAEVVAVGPRTNAPEFLMAAIAKWRGDFYLFPAEDGNPIARVHGSDGGVEDAGRSPIRVKTAGAAPCAAQ